MWRGYALVAYVYFFHWKHLNLFWVIRATLFFFFIFFVSLLTVGFPQLSVVFWNGRTFMTYASTLIYTSHLFFLVFNLRALATSLLWPNNISSKNKNSDGIFQSVALVYVCFFFGSAWTEFIYFDRHEPDLNLVF